MIIDLDHLNFSYHQKMIFKDAQLQINTPGIYGLIAPNGTGKTTLLQLIAGLLKPQSGTIDILAQPALKQWQLAKLAFLQDNSVLYPYLTGRDHLRYVQQNYQTSDQYLARLLDIVELTDFVDRKVKTYSLGQKQRLLITLALLMKPQVMLLDEPFNGLDPDTLFILRDIFANLAAHQVTMLISSHNLLELNKLTSQFFFIEQQQIVAKTATAELEQEYQRLYSQKRQHLQQVNLYEL